jgi:hypothetical protein
MGKTQQGQIVNVQQLVKVMTRSALSALVFLVFLFSILTVPEVTWENMLHAGLKALLAGILGQVFLLIIFDTVVRSIVASAVEAKAQRREGGLLFHFLKPDPDEITDSKSQTETSSQAA